MPDRLTTMRALAHPVRLQLLSRLTGERLSAAEAARALGLSQAGVSYHLRVLERAGLVQVVEEVTLRGGRARRFRHVPTSEPRRSARPAGAGTALQRRELEDQLVALLASELRRRHAARGDGPSISVDADLWVLPEVWQQVVALVDQGAAALHAAALPPGSPGAVRVSMTASLFPIGDA